MRTQKKVSRPPLQLSVTTTWGRRTLDSHSPAWKRLRLKVLERENYRCRFCGFRAYKYMVVDHTNGKAYDNRTSNLGVNCQMCDRLRHCGLAGLHGVLTLMKSQMSQLKIVRRTRAWVKVRGRSPRPKDIDPRAKPDKGMSMIDYANVLMSWEVGGTPPGYAGYRGFFTKTFAPWQLEWELKGKARPPE